MQKPPDSSGEGSHFRRDAYLTYCIKKAPVLYDLAQGIPLFAEYFVALEASVGPWFAFHYYGMLAGYEYRLVVGLDDEDYAATVQRAVGLLEVWRRDGYPFIDGPALRRATERRNMLLERMNLPPEETDHVRKRSLVAAREWIAGRTPIRHDWLHAVDQRLRHRPDEPPPVVQPLDYRCPAALGAHWARPCILCASPWPRTAITRRLESDWPRTAAGVREGDGRQRSRLSRSRLGLYYHGYSEQDIDACFGRTPEERWGTIGPRLRSRQEAYLRRTGRAPKPPEWWR